MKKAWLMLTRFGVGFAFLALLSNGLSAEAPVSSKQLEELQGQNRRLQEQMTQQQQLIENLSRKVSELEKANAGREKESRASPAQSLDEPATATRTGDSFGIGKVHLSGEGGLAFFHSESRGPFPNAEFRVDEAKLFVEAPVWKNVYFSGELNVTTREDPGVYLQPGELFLDIEDISQLWHQERQLNLRVGRFYIPFGEEYLARKAIDNPLISHSLSDLWGVDEGLEFYGSMGKFQYVAAVQNGGHPSLRDFDIDKAITARLGYDPAKWLHLSASAMRTGALNAQQDGVSELWFGNGFVRSLGSSATTTTFDAKLLEGDFKITWSKGHLKGAGGLLKYHDNDSAADNHREVYYYSLEGLHNLTPKLYAAARWSQVLASSGFPIVGDGDFKNYFIEELTQNLWRLSLGLGYRWSPNLIMKADYTFNQGKDLSGAKRTHENIVAAELVFKF